MKLFCLALIAASSLRADFSYRETSQESGKPAVTTTRLLKGNRMAEVTRARIVVFDLDRETVTEINLRNKTYSVTAFAQLKHAVPPAKEAAVKPTGQSRDVGVLHAKETVITMTAGAARVAVDAWVGTIPGYGDVRDFDRKLGDKLGYVFGSNLWTIAMNRPETLAGFEAAASELNQLEGTPLQSVIKMNPAGDAQPAAGAPPAPGRIATALGRVGLGPKNEPPDATAGMPAGLIEVQTTLDNFSAGPADGLKFDVPAGFKKIDSTFPK